MLHLDVHWSIVAFLHLEPGHVYHCIVQLPRYSISALLRAIGFREARLEIGWGGTNDDIPSFGLHQGDQVTAVVTSLFPLNMHLTTGPPPDQPPLLVTGVEQPSPVPMQRPSIDMVPAAGLTVWPPLRNSQVSVIESAADHFGASAAVSPSSSEQAAASSLMSMTNPGAKLRRHYSQPCHKGLTTPGSELERLDDHVLQNLIQL